MFCGSAKGDNAICFKMLGAEANLLAGRTPESVRRHAGDDSGRFGNSSSRCGFGSPGKFDSLLDRVHGKLQPLSEQTNAGLGDQQI